MIKYITCFSFFIFCVSCQSFKPDASTNRLHDIWGLKEVMGKKVERTQGGILELHVADQKFLFYTKDHSYEGKLRFKKDQQISFHSLSPAIPDNSGELESAFLSQLPSVDTWEIQKLYLHLLSNGKVVARFVKMD